ncbi:uncharacterized mitochondrial protein AtMg00860-like [Setaria viridis]|uniref:uncharacterized mitochondrial protein AtMg00860-like n=1 Tax=Setaria viridis TaxID=4556 RepID=UPI003B3BCFF9
MDPAKIEVVQGWPTPQSVRPLRGFLSLMGYYRRFIHNYGIITTPLIALLKREAFCWTNTATTTFNALKAALTSGPVLQLPDFIAPFFIDCDASSSDFGAILHQGVGLRA